MTRNGIIRISVVERPLSGDYVALATVVIGDPSPCVRVFQGVGETIAEAVTEAIACSQGALGFLCEKLSRLR